MLSQRRRAESRAPERITAAGGPCAWLCTLSLGCKCPSPEAFSDSGRSDQRVHVQLNLRNLRNVMIVMYLPCSRKLTQKLVLHGSHSFGECYTARKFTAYLELLSKPASEACLQDWHSFSRQSPCDISEFSSTSTHRRFPSRFLWSGGALFIGIWWQLAARLAVSGAIWQ